MGSIKGFTSLLQSSIEVISLRQSMAFGEHGEVRWDGVIVLLGSAVLISLRVKIFGKCLKYGTPPPMVRNGDCSRLVNVCLHGWLVS